MSNEPKLEYTPEVLAQVCVECHAAKTAKCLDRLPNGGKRWREKPHAARVLQAEMASRAKMAVDSVLAGETITCPQCGMVSFNQMDIAQRYCGNCHQFHAEMKQG